MSAIQSISLAKVQARFLEIVPKIERIARYKLRYIVDHDTRANVAAEVVGVAWKWFRSLAERGTDARRFSARLTYLAIRFVVCGRRVVGSESPRDVMSVRARMRHGFTLRQLQERGNYDDHQWQEALIDNRKTPVPDQAAFRQDMPHWLSTLGQRNRKVAESMMTGESTFALALRFGISPARISQLRRELHDDWERFHGNLNERQVSESVS